MRNKWRVPTINELQNAFNRKNRNSKNNGFISDYYWSSNINVDFEDNAWVINFHNGDIDSHHKLKMHYVRCIYKNSNCEVEWSEFSKNKMTWEDAHEYCKEMNDE